jgi:RecQ family ATP-dependent DNA helicase
MSDIYDLTLQEYFGYSELKPLQKNIIKTILEDKTDVLGILATGYGKSICYQLPFLILKQTKCIIIVSPLIALMEDQKSALEDKDIPVICMNSNMGIKTKEYEKSRILEHNENKIIYMTPEYLVNCQDFITDLFNYNQLAFIAIDESHCVSSWGSDFRPEYKSLKCLKEWLPNLNIIALTATATSKVRQDIVTSLGMIKYKEYVSSFDRPNLYMEFKLKTSDILYDLKPIVEQTDKKIFAIIYVRTREMTEKVVKNLEKIGVNAFAYHAGLNQTTRKSIQENFAKGEFNWIVATIAFGMGIDQDIGLVIHYGAPGDMESYYQEIGRAGRSGKESKCICFYEKDDMVINRILLREIKDPAYKRFRENQIRQMEKFLKSDTCRRVTILNYFGETVTFQTCVNCDNCTREKECTQSIQKSIQYPIYLLLKFIIDSKINSGLGKIISVLSGKREAKIKQFWPSPFFGLGKVYNIDFWKCIVNICIYNDLLKEETIPSGFGTILKLTSNSLIWYKEIKEILKKNKITTDTYEQILFVIDDLRRDYKIPRDSLHIKDLIKTNIITSTEEILQEYNLI